MILSVGAGGPFGGLVVRALACRGTRVRSLVHKQEDFDCAQANGAREIVFGDLHDRKSLDAALDGVEGVFYIAPPFERNEATLGLGLVGAARRGGVRRFVFSSVMHPTVDLENYSEKVPVEGALYASGMEFVVLHPAMFFQDLEHAWPVVLEGGKLSEPFSRNAPIARVDYRDVADVAAIALLDDRLTYGTFELCSDEILNREEIALLMSEVLGRYIEPAESTFDAWALKAGVPHDERQRRLLKSMYDYFGTHGAYGNSLALRTILGREPRTLRGYIEELAGVEQMRSVA
jgi:uncharacterized protein YbjT (DUF2867 family)